MRTTPGPSLSCSISAGVISRRHTMQRSASAFVRLVHAAGGEQALLRQPDSYLLPQLLLGEGGYSHGSPRRTRRARVVECADRRAEPEGSGQMPQVRAPGMRQPESPQEARTIYTRPLVSSPCAFSVPADTASKAGARTPAQWGSRKDGDPGRSDPTWLRMIPLRLALPAAA
jgi:hypothetical protein